MNDKIEEIKEEVLREQKIKKLDLEIQKYDRGFEYEIVQIRNDFEKECIKATEEIVRNEKIISPETQRKIISTLGRLKIFYMEIELKYLKNTSKNEE